MKNTQNSSEPQIFQHLDAKYLKSPLKYLQWFYGKYKLAAWQEQVRYFLTTGSAPTAPLLFDSRQIYEHLVNHVDLAYLIKERDGASGLAGHFLAGFFDFKPRQSWLETLDHRLITENPAIEKSPGKYGAENHIANLIELLHYLNYYFYLIAIGKSKHFRIPMYVLPDERLVDEMVAADQRTNDLLMDTGLEPTEIVEASATFEPGKRVSLPEWLQLSSDIGAVRDFFGINSLAGWKENLWRWYQAVLAENRFWSGADLQFSGTHLLEIYAYFCALLEMYRSLPADQSRATGSTEYGWTENDSKEHSLFEAPHPRSIFRAQDQLIILHGQESINLHYVSHAEAQNPLPVINALIGQHSQPEWEGILYEWLSYGLSANALTDSGYGVNGSRVYQTLAKITELSYVLAFADEIEYKNPS